MPGWRDELRSPRRHLAVGGIRQHDPGLDAGVQRLANLLQGDVRFGGKGLVRRDTGAATKCRVVRPRFRQIEAPRHRQTGPLRGHRQTDGDLAVILLSNLATILAADAQLMPSLLRKLVSSMIQKGLVPGSRRGNTHCATPVSSARSDHVQARHLMVEHLVACLHVTFSGSTLAARGSMLLRGKGNIIPEQ
ncbi:hypothetical protein L861_06720 [Litchfieldella anticariensis FP35 = DSM 16096]|uniref:Uncharacterized protein n=1 Tax=Litchfieldella anticariensis (strain DSM 16096 / CECT 5854 / CIP 108499 / LMG 22089 / FP35) TaxID=1121939 RepID=S2KEL5_LITA3|nr:hypothetical protein L861_06720 [Halomonas anticariensis FP35 = DSM 16096]